MYSQVEDIRKYANQNEMKLNVEKSKYMIINYTNNYQINTRLHMEQQLLEQISETRLLGVIIRDDLSFKSNTNSIVKRAYKRMLILHNLSKFHLPLEDLVTVYVLYIRSVLEQSAVVWHSAITKGEQLDLERVQKCA